MKPNGWIAICCCALLSLAYCAEQNLPLPEMTVAKVAKAPAIDGKIDKGEWDQATACTAFTTAFESTLCRIQTVAWLTYDDTHLYVCLKNNRGPTYTLLSKRGRTHDDAAIVFDHSNEIWFSPPVVPAPTYQTLFNTYPGVFDCKMIPSVGSTSMSWSANWEFAASECNDYWVIEAKAPIKSFGCAIQDNSTWRALFCTDVLGNDTGGFRAWAPGGGFAEINRHGFVRFVANAPAFQLLEIESIRSGKFSFPMAVTASKGAEADVAVTLRVGSGIDPADGDVVLNKNVKLAAGAREEFALSGEIAADKLPLRKGHGQDKGTPGGFCEVTAKTAAGQMLYHQVFPFVIDGYQRTPPAEIKKTPYETPFGLSAFYAPLNKKLIVKVDRFYLERRAEAAKGVAKLVDPRTGAVVAERPLSPFFCDYADFPMDLSKVDVPVETEEEWAKAEPIRAENKQTVAQNKTLKKEGKPELPLKPVPEFPAAEYKLEVTLTTEAGQEIAKTDTLLKLKGYQFEWMNNNVGISDKVIPPWTPLKHENGMLSMWNKSYRLNTLGLADEIVNSGAKQLSGPMKLMARIGGQDQEVRPAAEDRPFLKRLTEAEADFSATSVLGDLEFSVKTRAEFDGFVLNTMTINPRKPTALDRLSLVVTMPKSEAPCLVASPGGWNAYHGWTPERWDSRETSLGTFQGNFIAYVLLTDSERAFCYFADNEKGWILDPKEPTQEVFTQGDQVTLRVNFVTKACTIEKPTTIQYGWMVSPQKPQPKGWRNWFITGRKPNPHATCVFWCDADLAVLWPYYCSPYPWNYEKSKAALVEGPDSCRKCVGNIAHAIARYRDYKGRTFEALAADWGERLGSTSNGNVARSRGPNDFQLWHFDRWCKQSGLSALYFDENYLGDELNYLTGGAYLLPNEQIQPGYSYLGLREYNKRLRYMFHENGKAQPNLWLHTTGGQPIYAWMPDVGMEGENIEPTGLDNDYIECLPAGRLRAIGGGANLGCAPMIMHQADRHWNDAFSPFCTIQFVGWTVLHDALPGEGSELWPVLASETEMWHDDIRFLPYWKTGQGIACDTKDVLVSGHARAGHTVLWIMNTSREDRDAAVKIDFAKLGLDAAKTTVFDAETSERYALQDGTLKIKVPARLWRAVRLMQPKKLTEAQTFSASFDTEDGIADEAFGYRYPTAGGFPKAEGKTGSGLGLIKPVSFAGRHHVSAERGTIAWNLRGAKGLNGTLLQLGGCKLTCDKTKWALQVEKLSEIDDKGKKRTVSTWEKLAEGVPPAGAPDAWHAVSLSWTNENVTVKCDGADVLTAKLAAPLALHTAARGHDIISRRIRTAPPAISFGPMHEAVMDDLVISK